MNLDSLVAQAHEPMPPEPGTYPQISPGGEWTWHELAWHPAHRYSSDPVASKMLRQEAFLARVPVDLNAYPHLGYYTCRFHAPGSHLFKADTEEEAVALAYAAWKGIEVPE